METVAAYLLLALWPVPARKWEEDRGWVYLGLALRYVVVYSSGCCELTLLLCSSIAVDINLHHVHTVQPRNEQHAREMLNRTRVWLNCYNLDRSFSSQYGKAPIINNLDYVACHSEFWYKSSPYNIPDIDIHLCAYNAELKVLADYRAVIFSDPEHPVGLNKVRPSVGLLARMIAHRHCDRRMLMLRLKLRGRMIRSHTYGKLGLYDCGSTSGTRCATSSARTS